MTRLCASLVMLIPLVGPSASSELQKKSATDIDTIALTRESQSTDTSNHRMNVVWFIPFEFWQAVFKQSDRMSPQQCDRFLEVLEGYATVCIVRADIGAAGAFDYHDREDVEEVLSMAYVNAAGERIPIVAAAAMDESVRLVFDTMRPVLAAALGKLGGNMLFFVIDDRDAEDKRIILPDAAGELAVHFADEVPQEGLTLTISFPFEALFVPRLCAACKHALQASWHYCPWDGTQIGD